MQIIKDTNGFPYIWKAGRVEHLIRDILERKAQDQLNVDRVMIINPTWMQDHDINTIIQNANPDFIICHNFVDPAVPRIFDSITQSGRPHIILGNAEQFRLDFWAMVCDLYFQHYTEQELELKSDARKFICLNRKPHPHRQSIVKELLPYQTQGFISLGLPVNPITLEETFGDEQGINDEYGNLGIDETLVSKSIRNDIFSVGNIEIWNRSLLCLVTETEFRNEHPNNFFTSEKTFKPIIGMRPFFIYGQAPLRQYLKDSGFDIFDDVFDYSIVDESKFDPALQHQYAEVAIKAINQCQNPFNEYHHLYAKRCLANKNRFRSYVYEQWNRLYNLDLRNYV